MKPKPRWVRYIGPDLKAEHRDGTKVKVGPGLARLVGSRRIAVRFETRERAVQHALRMGLRDCYPWEGR